MTQNKRTRMTKLKESCEIARRHFKRMADTMLETDCECYDVILTAIQYYKQQGKREIRLKVKRRGYGGDLCGGF